MQASSEGEKLKHCSLLKESDEGKSSQWAELRAIYSLVHFAWKKEHTYALAVANGLAGWSGTWKEYDWKIGDKEIWGRDVWIDRPEWAKTMRIFSVPCECLPKGEFSRGGFQ